MSGASDLVPISALQHMLYCPRQCALIHNERQWAENHFTAEGRVLHERVDTGHPESRGDIRIERSVALRCTRLGISGIADVVEIESGRPPYPVEYKRGRPKAHKADEIQLCAQALCLEEMLGCSIPKGALFYGRTRRRKEVVFDALLRALTEQTAAQTRIMLLAGVTPSPEYEKRKCDACSLKHACQPRAARGKSTVARWLQGAVEN